MKKFVQWQELREMADTMDFAGPSQSMTQAQPQPGITPIDNSGSQQNLNPATPPPFGTDGYGNFKAWYDFHRGHWKEVEAAAAKSKSLKAFLDTAAQAFNQAKANRMDPGRASFQYSDKGQTATKTGFGQIGDVVERKVSKIIPQHSHQENEKAQQAALDQKLARMRHIPGQQDNFQGADPNGATGAMQNPSSMADGGDTLSFKNYIQDLERRLADVETKIGIQPGQSQMQKMQGVR
jgi:hypothetical protein